MIHGVVNVRHEAVVCLKVRGPGMVISDVDVIVDSGFTSALTLPMTTISSLGLVRQSSSAALLADGSVQQFDVFAAEVEWGGVWRTVLVSAIGSEPLMGMRLLTGHKLEIEVTPNGLVEITPLP
ncbi:MAG: hypothetical protein QM703_14745 [Gemmatales bacterium]